MPDDRAALRRRLIDARQAFAASAAFESAQSALAARLADILHALEPACLGAYWAMRGEFNAAVLWEESPARCALGLPYARRVPRDMHFRAWDGSVPKAVDECGLPAAAGPPVEPDVVLVPCVGYTRAGWRLGYGGGYFDRWLAERPHVTAVGVAWSAAETVEFAPQPHDRPLTLIVTEAGVFG